MKKGILFSLLAFTLVVSVLFGACAKPAQAPEEPIRIGLVTSLTGDAAWDGIAAKEGVELYLKMINSRFNGREIQLLIEDDQSSPQTAVEKVRTLVEGKKVHFLIGPLWAASVAAIGSYVDAAGIPTLALYQHGEAYTLSQDFVALHPWLFVGAPSGQAIAMASGAWTAKNHGWHTALGTAADFVGGHDMIEGTTAGFEAQGAKMVWEQYAPFGTPDFGPYLVSLEEKAKEYNIDGVFVWYVAHDAVVFLQQYAQYGLNKKYPLVSPTGAMLRGDVISQAGEGTIGSIALSAFYVNPQASPIAKDYWDAFVKSYGREPMELNHTGYINASIALEALKLTGGDTNPEKLRQALYDMKFDTVAWNDFSFDKDTHLAKASLAVIEVVKEDNKITTRQIDLIKGVSTSKEYGY